MKYVIDYFFWSEVRGSEVRGIFIVAETSGLPLPKVPETVVEVEAQPVSKNRIKIVRSTILGKLENGQVLKVAVKEVANELIFVSVYDTAKIKKDDKETYELQGSQ